MELKRVVVTGIGAVTPLGNTAAETWQNMLAGVSGAAPITHFDAFPKRMRLKASASALVEEAHALEVM